MKNLDMNYFQMTKCRFCGANVEFVKQKSGKNYYKNKDHQTIEHLKHEIKLLNSKIAQLKKDLQKSKLLS